MNTSKKLKKDLQRELQAFLKENPSIRESLEMFDITQKEYKAALESFDTEQNISSTKSTVI